MAEVVAENWNEMFLKMKKSLEGAIFISIDNEFSGLRDMNKEDISLFDNNEQRYSKIRNHINEYFIVQIGISVFSYNADSSGYTCEVFTVYLFPSTTGRKDTSLKFQASSIEFLCRYNFDFNKMMHHGVTYMSLAEMELLKRAMQNGKYSQQQKMSLSVDIADLYKSSCSEAMNWAVRAKIGDETTIKYPACLSSYLLHKDIRMSCPDICTFDVQDGGILIRKVCLEVRANYEMVREMQETEQAFEKLIGFSKFFSLLVQAKVPIIGHNVLLDLMLMYQQFIGPLPGSYNLFKKKLQKTFPTIYDTKYLSLEVKRKISINDGWDSDLQRLYNYLLTDRCNNYAPGAPNISTNSYAQEDLHLSADGDNNSKRAGLKAKFHDAGWDSYCAGYVFLRLAHINAVFDEAVKNEDKTSEFNLTWKNLLESVQPFQNRVHISMGKSKHIALEGKDQEAKWNQIVFLTAKGNKTFNMRDIEDNFVQYGSLDIKIISPKSALLATSTPECLKDILKVCKNHPLFRARRYSKLRHSAHGRYSMWAGIFAAFASGTFLVYSACH